MSSLDLSKRHILLVDDEVFSRDTVAHTIRNIGQPMLYQAGHGREALEMLDEHRNIDLVICDFKMPKMNGLELLREIRVGGAPVARDIMFAMLTGFSEKPLVHAALALDVNAFLIKPVSKKMLVDRFRRMYAIEDGAEWIKPTSEYVDVDTHIPSIDPKEQGQSVFDKVADQEFAAAKVAQALRRRRSGAGVGSSPVQGTVARRGPSAGPAPKPASRAGSPSPQSAPSKTAGTKGQGRFSALRGRFTNSDLAGHIADGVERLTDDMGRDHAVKVVDHLDGMQKKGLMSLNDIAGALNNPAFTQGPSAELMARSEPGGQTIERVVGLGAIPSGAALARDIRTKDGEVLIQDGIALSGMVRAILWHLNELQLLDLPDADGEPGAYVHVAEDFRDEAAPKNGPERRIHVDELSEGDTLARHVYTEDGRMYMQAGATMTGRLVSLVKDLVDLGTVSPEIWIHR